MKRTQTVISENSDLKGKTAAPSLFILAAAALWGCIGVFFRIISSYGLTSLQVVIVRVCLSTVLYWIYMLITDPKALIIHFRDIWCFVGTGICSLVIFNFFYFKAIELSSMGIAAVLLYTAPIFVVLISAFLFKEGLTVMKLICLGLTFFGCALVSGVFSSVGQLSFPVIFYGLMSGLGYAAYSIFGVFALRRYDSKTVTAYSFLFGSAALIFFADFNQISALFCPRGILASLGISVFCCILPYIFYTKGLKNTPAGKASMLAALEPVVAAALGVMLYHEPLSVSLVLGIVCVVGAIGLMNVKWSKVK